MFAKNCSQETNLLQNKLEIALHVENNEIFMMKNRITASALKLVLCGQQS